MMRARELINAGDHLLAVEIPNKLVYAEPENAEGRQLPADAFEQVGYQQGSPRGVRNSFLAAALELRSGIPTGVPPVPGRTSLRAGVIWITWASSSDSLEGQDAAFMMNLLTPTLLGPSSSN